jgi:hypothetical protein
MDRSIARNRKLIAVLIGFGVAGLAAASPANAEPSGPTSANDIPRLAPNEEASVRPDYLPSEDLASTPSTEKTIQNLDKFQGVAHLPGLDNRLLSRDLDENLVGMFAGDQFAQLSIPFDIGG